MAVCLAQLESGCGTPNVYVQLTAPSNATAGSAFTLIVTVIANGSQDRIFNSVIHFTSSDPAASLPPDYLFTPNDAGSHAFTNGVTLTTFGKQTISATDDIAPSITGSIKIGVSAPTRTAARRTP